MPNPVAFGSMIKCSQGIAPMPLIVVPIARVTSGFVPLATVNDVIPFVNIVPFGMCNSAANPAVIAARAAALGSPVPGPCVPVTMGPWSKGAQKVKIGGAAALTKDSTCRCTWNGSISVVNTPATRVNVK